ncbi:hypothetical protein C922_01832 [Plasmodium inui San Antonio 1]|uniref:Uncharacterized protein n=1 Tax=Plasmodium inui San Antonio 1 TaxID=1237626 RepID=W7A343_9APIC|nr:hypothetical protein C922_01832 [Plasmodium inui San Antonio 1]EUD67647.1 hypothetical protein C922_01832 [Plasmodium inui San Antonio 1]
MNIIKKELTHFPCFLRRWLHNNRKDTRQVSSRRSIEPCLSEVKRKGCDVNVLSLVISNNNLCYCLLRNKIIKKIGLINIKKDFQPYEQGPSSTPKRKNNLDKEELTYSYDREDTPLSFNIREILTVLNLVKLHSDEDGQHGERASGSGNGGVYDSASGSSAEWSQPGDPPDGAHIGGAKGGEEQQQQPQQSQPQRQAQEWIIGIEKVNDKYEKNRTKEKILSILVYFLNSIFKCQIVFFCPKEARKYFSTKCSCTLETREETYKYIKDKVRNFPSVSSKSDNKVNCLFSDSYVMAFYTYRYYMHHLVKNNRTVFNYLESEVRRNRSFNNILQSLKRVENDESSHDLRELLRDRIGRIVDRESYRLVDRDMV